MPFPRTTTTPLGTAIAGGPGNSSWISLLTASPPSPSPAGITFTFIHLSTLDSSNVFIVVRSFKHVFLQPSSAFFSLLSSVQRSSGMSDRIASSLVEGVVSPLTVGPSSQTRSTARMEEGRMEQPPMNEVLAQLAEREARLIEQQEALLKNARGISRLVPTPIRDQETSSDGSARFTPASDRGQDSSLRAPLNNTGVQQDAKAAEDDAEVRRLTRELEAAKSEIARRDQELSQMRITKQSIDQLLESPRSETARPLAVAMPHVADATTVHHHRYQAAFPAATWGPSRGGDLRDRWACGDENDGLDTDIGGPSVAPDVFNRNIWATPGHAFVNNAPVGIHHQPLAPAHVQGHGPTQVPAPAARLSPSSVMAAAGRDASNNWVGTSFNRAPVAPPTQGVSPFPGHASLSGYGGRHGGHQRGPIDNIVAAFSPNHTLSRATLPANRAGPAYGNVRNPAWSVFGHGMTAPESTGSAPMPFNMWPSAPPPTSMPSPYPHPVGTPLSGAAPEFSMGTATNSYNGWGSMNASGSHQVNVVEPLNYRRLLDRTVDCDWKYIVDKIVGHNDQQGSLFLQQKLKVGTTEQKFEIVEAIVAQAYPLMINRFGNFLIQRCFEHGTPQQVVAIANAIRGNTLTLSMDPFGCHVVQKAFDCVPEEYKAVMVHELLRRIPETVIHRYACHVWQKLLELRWNDSPPQIMKHVNEALRGMWPEVALGETGSLVVQNIFENCLEEDKRPCINEVLGSIDLIARGQFGNWCIQHICAQGASADRSYAIDYVLRNAVEFSLDQYASKVVEKCLRVNAPDFLEHYLARVCEARPGRPRIPLIDIAADQYGNFLIQHILMTADPQHREIIASHIRKHMVSLRGSKYGGRVGMLCANPALMTRPGPPGPPVPPSFVPRYHGGRFNGLWR
ncbi:MAG: hypothetical protein M1823_004610 [Watsoniomyces obsoletus]|nr:MAG: hypothetical protein M1823_004610 [Watsoniomyces obsoletus]